MHPTSTAKLKSTGTRLTRLATSRSHSNILISLAFLSVRQYISWQAIAKVFDRPYAAISNTAKRKSEFSAGDILMGEDQS
jgi:lambda repressor-like predicted transcriptional regulator